MRRHILWLVTSHLTVAALVWIAARREPAPPTAVSPLPTRITVSRQSPANGEVLDFRPFAVFTRGRAPERIGPPAPEGSQWMLSFDEGETIISCELVARR